MKRKKKGGGGRKEGESICPTGPVFANIDNVFFLPRGVFGARKKKKKGRKGGKGMLANDFAAQFPEYAVNW